VKLMEIRLEHIHKAFEGKPVLRDFSCRFAEGKAGCILGASGCGKTTLLRLIAGLEIPDSGSIRGIENKKISAVFQEDRLIENLSAEKNIMLTAKKGFAREDARHLLLELGLAENASIEDTIRKASAISAASAMREETGIFRLEDMERILSQVQVVQEVKW